jgi:hypothetical protein
METEMMTWDHGKGAPSINEKNKRMGNMERPLLFFIKG